MDIKKACESIFNIPPLPKTKRGFGIHIDATTKKGNKLIYCNGKFVIVRSLDNEFKSYLFPGHKSNVNVAKFSPNGQWIASGDETGNVIIWGSENMKVKSSVIANRGVLDISWAADNSQIIAVGDGGNGVYARIFRIDSSNSIGNISNHSNKILSCALRPERPYYALTGSEDLAVNVYKGLPYKHVKTHREHKKYVNCVRYNSTGELAASVGSDAMIFIYSAEGQILRSKKAHKGSIYSCCFSPDDTKLLTVGGDKTAKIWNTESFELESSFEMGGSVDDMQVACAWVDGFAITISLSGCINFLDVESEGKVKTVWRGHQSKALKILVDKENKIACTSGQKGKIVLWDFKDNSSDVFTGDDQSNVSVNNMAFDSEKKQIYSIGFDHTLRISDVETMTTKKTSVKLGNQTVGLCVGKDLIAIVDTKKNFYFSTDLEKLDMKTKELKFIPTSMSISPEKLIAIGSEDNKVYLYKIDGGELQEVRVLSEHSEEVISVKFSEDGSYLLTIGNEKKIYIYKSEDNYEKTLNSRGWNFHSAAVTSGCFDVEQNKAVTGSKDESVIIWNELQKGNRARRKNIRPAHLMGVNKLESFGEGKFISAGDDRCIAVREL